MDNFEIPEFIEFSTQLRKYSPRDRAHADLFNEKTQVMLNNEAYLFREIDDVRNNISEQILKKLAGMAFDVAKLSFQLDIKEVVSTSNMTHVIVDEINSDSSIILISGKCDKNGVYI